jgi:hypothetical protein
MAFRILSLGSLLNGDDGPKNLPYANPSSCSIGADAGLPELLASVFVVSVRKSCLNFISRKHEQETRSKDYGKAKNKCERV